MLPLQGRGFDPWLGELGSHMPCGMAKIKWNDGAFKHYFRDCFLHLILLYNYVCVYICDYKSELPDKIYSRKSHLILSPPPVGNFYYALSFHL